MIEGEGIVAEPPVIVEPSASSSQRARLDRPTPDASGLYQSTSHSKITDLPSRLSGWFSHTFNTSNNDLSLPVILSQQGHISGTSTLPLSSPKGKNGSSLLTAAKHGKGHLDKAMRYLLDSDATPDRCTDPIWLLGLKHPGYEPPEPAPALAIAHSFSTPVRRGSADSRRSPVSASGFRSPSDNQLSSSLNSSASGKRDPGANWPPVFYEDFTSRIWLTYRSQFAPIRDTTLAALSYDPGDPSCGPPPSPPSKKWFGLAERGWTSDAGWGCMLRTGQSLLANALLHLHLGREWRKPPYPVQTADYATYVQLITWFLDSPSPLCPFGVHRMALAGKDLGKEVGQWFGPSTAAGAIKALVSAFPKAGLGVSIAGDSVIYQSDVYAASHDPVGSPKRNARKSWGDKGVLVLIGTRLGIDGVNPVYYEAIKEIYTWPQSVGIAGGRPSSSYYFVGSQADNLFYLDPHHARPTVPLRFPPGEHGDGHNGVTEPLSTNRPSSPAPRRPGGHTRSPTSPPRSGSGSTSGRRSSHYQSSVSSSSSSHSHGRWQSDLDEHELGMSPRSVLSGIDEGLDPLQEHYVNAYTAAELKTFHCDRIRKMPLSGLDPSMLIGFFCRDEDDWKDFRRRVEELGRKHKIILSVNDEPPSWPSDSDSNLDLESISDPEMDLEEPEDSSDDFSLDVEGETRSLSKPPSIQSTGSHSSSSTSSPASFSTSESKSLKGDDTIEAGDDLLANGDEKRSSEVDTEEDPIDPITPHATTFPEQSIVRRSKVKTREQSIPGGFGDEEEDDDDDDLGIEIENDIEDDWIDSGCVTPPSILSSSKSEVEVVNAGSMANEERVGSKSKSKPGSKQRDGDKEREPMKSKSRRPDITSKTLPTVETTTATASKHYPFPTSITGEVEAEDDKKGDNERRIPQMRTTKARDGGRTQSGGVRGILLTEDGDDF